MDRIKEVCYETYTNYFTNLEYLGFFPDEVTYKIILLSFIDDIMDGKFNPIISEEDYKIIDNFLYKIYGSSCLIPYPKYNELVSLNPKSRYPKYENIFLRSALTKFMEVETKSFTIYTDNTLKKVTG